MKAHSKHWTLNHKLAAAAVALGFLAIFGKPHPGHVAKLDTLELANLVEREVDHVSAEEVAAWVIEGRADYRLIDLRDADAFAEYHIPTAEQVPLSGLPDYGLGRNEKIVLYSDGGIHAAQAWFLLKALDYKGVYMILDGLNAWKEDVLFPNLPAGVSAEEQADFERRKQVSAYFGGRPGAESPPGERPETLEMPAVQMPAAPVVPKATQRKRKEGC